MDSMVGQLMADAEVIHLMVLFHEKKCLFVRLLGQPAGSQHQFVSNHFAHFDVLVPINVSSLHT